jgi:hypothetical protein
LGTGEHPELEAAWRRDREAETALWVDYKSLFVFGDILVASYVSFSEVIWEAPEGVNHHDGLSTFLRSVERARAAPGLSGAFADYMDILYNRLMELDDLVGFYRDKFITHLPPDMSIGAGMAISVPLDFHYEHGRRREVTEAELRNLRKTVRQVEKAEELDLGADEPDPRRKLRTLGTMLGRFKHAQSSATIRALLKEWGSTSPPALKVATSLNDVLECWGNVFIERIGLVQD